MATNPVEYEDAMKMAEREGLCPNCFHTCECDVREVEGGRPHCNPDLNDMGHTCPPNTSDSAAQYEHFILEPMRRRHGN